MSDLLAGHAAPSFGVTTAVLDQVYIEEHRAISVNVSGAISIVMKDGSTADFQAAAGMVYPFRVKTVNSAGTTASGIYLWK